MAGVLTTSGSFEWRRGFSGCSFSFLPLKGFQMNSTDAVRAPLSYFLEAASGATGNAVPETQGIVTRSVI